MYKSLVSSVYSSYLIDSVIGPRSKNIVVDSRTELYSLCSVKRNCFKMANLLKELPESYRSYYQSGAELMGDENTKLKDWNGYRFTPGFEPETALYAMEHHEPKENEILIISFPKTGTTWVREIVRQILYGNDEKLDLITRDLDPPVVYLSTGHSKKYNILHNMPIPRTYYATHLPVELVNVEKYKCRNMKFIYTLRNPKDRLVSLFNFLPQFPWYAGAIKNDPKDWNAFFEMETKGQFPICGKIGKGYMEHILEWLPHIKDNDNAMITVFEEMIKNPQKEVRRIADFLGVKMSDEEIIKTCEKTSFAAIKKFDESSTSPESSLHKAVNLLRKGQIGDWKNYFSPEQSAFIDDEVEKKLKGTGISFIYE